MSGVYTHMPCDLQGETRVHGTRVGIMAKPSAEFVASIWAVWLNGGVAVPLALSYPEAELVHVLTDAV
jgi:malonyl-CoA/methylmalonyl-CoA synthetase